MFLTLLYHFDFRLAALVRSAVPKQHVEPEDVFEDKGVSSGVIPLAGHNWQIWLYAGGLSYEGEDHEEIAKNRAHVGVHLELLSSELLSSEKFRGCCEIRLLADGKKDDHIFKGTWEDDNPYFCSDHFIRRKYLENESLGYLV